MIKYNDRFYEMIVLFDGKYLNVSLPQFEIYYCTEHKDVIEPRAIAMLDSYFEITI